jgi:hypothetical protein
VWTFLPNQGRLCETGQAPARGGFRRAAEDILGLPLFDRVEAWERARANQVAVGADAF